VIEATTRGMKDCGEVLKNAMRLRSDISVNQLSGGGIERDLARHEKHRARPYTLGIRTDGRRGCWRGNRLAHDYAAFTTLLERRQRVQTRRRRIPPLTIARTR
jgi:hypothetical protein